MKIINVVNKTVSKVQLVHGPRNMYDAAFAILNFHLKIPQKSLKVATALFDSVS